MAIVDHISEAANIRYSERQDCIERNRKGRYDINNIIRRFFITGDGGTGKTFTYNVLLKHFKRIIIIYFSF
jgi:Cdc6-like AAA superfamily ATPase